MSEIKIQEKLDEVVVAVKTVQDVQDKLDGELKKLDGYDLEKQAKAVEAATKGVEEVNKLVADGAEEKTILTGRIDELEAIVAKSGGSAQPEGDSVEVKQAMASFMKRGVAIDGDLVEQMCKELAVKGLLGASQDKIDSVTKDLVAAVGPTGGYFITPDRSSKISERIFETSPIRPLADIQTTNSDVLEMLLDDDEAAAGWVGETQSRADTDSADIALIKIPIHEIFAQPKATQKMLDDAGFDIESWHNRKVSSKFARMENTSFVLGDGSKKPKGFLAYAAWAAAGTYQRDAVEQVTTTGASGALDTGDDLITLQNSLLEDYQGGATWGMRRATFGDVMKLKDSSGRYLLNRQVIAEGADKILLGNPVSFMSDMPAVAGSALSVVLADFREFYTIVDRFGIRILRDAFTSKPYTKFYTTKRVGGAVTNFEAGKILKIKA